MHESPGDGKPSQVFIAATIATEENTLDLDSPTQQNLCQFLFQIAFTCAIFTFIIHYCHGTNLCRRMRSGS
jgi:hypothetical protein